jgi:hypothetical protein
MQVIRDNRVNATLFATNRNRLINIIIIITPLFNVLTNDWAKIRTGGKSGTISNYEAQRQEPRFISKISSRIILIHTIQ